MGPKLLFVIGIVAAHGAIGAVWVTQELPEPRAPIASCVNTAAPLPYFNQQRGELLAMQVEAMPSEDTRLP
jgi:hypothetical protein